MFAATDWFVFMSNKPWTYLINNAKVIRINLIQYYF